VPGFFGAYGKKTGQGDWLAEGEGFEPSSLEPNGPTGIGEMHPVGNGPRSESRIPRRRAAKLQPAAIDETPGRLINSRAATTQNAQKPIPTLGTKTRRGDPGGRGLSGIPRIGPEEVDRVVDDLDPRIADRQGTILVHQRWFLLLGYGDVRRRGCDRAAKQNARRAETDGHQRDETGAGRTSAGSMSETRRAACPAGPDGFTLFARSGGRRTGSRT
jgi:hypothetical protein